MKDANYMRVLEMAVLERNKELDARDKEIESLKQDRDYNNRRWQEAVVQRDQFKMELEKCDEDRLAYYRKWKDAEQQRVYNERKWTEAQNAYNHETNCTLAARKQRDAAVEDRNDAISQMDRLVARNKDLEEAYDDSVECNKNLAEQLKELESKNISLKLQLNHERGTCARNHGKDLISEQHVEELEKELADRYVRIKQLEERLESEDSKRKSLENHLEILIACNDNQRETIEHLQRDLDASRKAHSITIKGARTINMRKRVDSLVRARDKYKEKCAVLLNERDQLLNELGTMRKHRTNARLELRGIMNDSDMNCYDPITVYHKVSKAFRHLMDD